MDASDMKSALDYYTRERIESCGYRLVSETGGREIYEIDEDRLSEELLEIERAGLSSRDRWLIGEIENYMAAKGIGFDELGQDYQQEYMRCLDRELRNLTG